MLLRGLIRGLRRGLQRGLGRASFSNATQPFAITESSDGVDRTSYPMASVTPPANTLCLIGVCSTHGVTAETPNSLTGYNITWTAVTNGAGSVASAGRRISWFYGFGAAPSNSAGAIGFAGTMTGCSWALIAVPGSPLISPFNGLTANANSTSVSLTLAAAMKSLGNLHIFAVSHPAIETTAVPTGWTKLVDRTVTPPNGDFAIAWAYGERAVTPSWATSGATVIVGIEAGSP